MDDTSPPYDVVVIGAGPGGYSAAIRAGQLGLKVACIEGNPHLGGTCLNVGCMPSKALLHASELFESARTEFQGLGIDVTPQLNLPQMMLQKQQSVDKLVKGIEFLFRKNKVDLIRGWGRLEGNGRIRVRHVDGTESGVVAKNIVIATGSVPATLPNVRIDKHCILDSTDVLSLEEVPKSLLIIGAGVIGLELGSVWRRLGAEVTVLEYQDRILPGIDGEIAKSFERMLRKQGMKFRLGVQVTGAEATGGDVTVHFTPLAGGAPEALRGDKLLVAIGRTPYSEGLGLDAVGLVPGRRGVIAHENFRTSAPGVWVIGDVTTGPMLAHKAEDEAVACIETIAGQPGFADHDIIPNVIYTRPEVASVGRTEEELIDSGIAYRAGRFNYTANSRARINHETEGFVKVLADAKSDRILGVHMLGPVVSEMIGEACVAMAMGANAEDVARTSHPHPTRSEALRQAAMDVAGWTMQA